jgi:hypothetical protein
MSVIKIDHRKNEYLKLQSIITNTSDIQLQSLLKENARSTKNKDWVKNQVLIFGKSKVFVKFLPITDIEYNNLFSTKNHFALPNYYNYGIGSTGFGAFRELTTHIKTTTWVLEGTNTSFPLMYHYRVLPINGQRSHWNWYKLKNTIRYWGNNKNIEKFLKNRESASYELVLFIEYIPYTLNTWLQENPNMFQKTFEELKLLIIFFNQNEIIHFDAHFDNILTDGEQIFLSDFGLVLDKKFDLNEEEESFFEQNLYYPYGLILWSCANLIWLLYNSHSQRDKRKIAKQCGIKRKYKPYQQRSILLNNIERICAEEIMNLDDSFVTFCVKYRSSVELMQNFILQMRENPRKDTEFPQTELQQLTSL